MKDNIIEIYTILTVCLEVHPSCFSLTGSCSLDIVGLLKEKPKDIDFYIYTTDKSKIYDNIIKSIERGIIKEYEATNRIKYPKESGISLVQIKYNNIKVDLFLGDIKKERIDILLDDVVPLLSPIETLKSKFSFYDDKTKEYIKWFKDVTLMDNHNALKDKSISL